MLFEENIKLVMIKSVSSFCCTLYSLKAVLKLFQGKFHLYHEQCARFGNFCDQIFWSITRMKNPLADDTVCRYDCNVVRWIYCHHQLTTINFNSVGIGTKYYTLFCHIFRIASNQNVYLCVQQNNFEKWNCRSDVLFWQILIY